jgi:hypothetical protein
MRPATLSQRIRSLQQFFKGLADAPAGDLSVIRGSAVSSIDWHRTDLYGID